MDTIKIGSLNVSRFILGSNPFSGFSHQGSQRDAEMEHYFTAAHIKATLRNAEELGVTAIIARADHHVMRTLMEYWDEGGKLIWLAQTCPGVGPTLKTIDMALAGGAKAIHIHGGVTDNCLAKGDMSDPLEGIARVREAGLPIGIAGHTPGVFRWAVEEKAPLDYAMCCYYDSAPRHRDAVKAPDEAERFLAEDRRAMAATIQELPWPVIHYKVMAAGRNDPAEAVAFAAKAMRPQDAVCVGVFPKDNPEMLAEDVRMFEEAWKRQARLG